MISEADKDLLELHEIADDYRYFLCLVNEMRNVQRRYYENVNSDATYSEVRNKEFAVDMYLQSELTGESHETQQSKDGFKRGYEAASLKHSDFIVMAMQLVEAIAFNQKDEDEEIVEMAERLAVQFHKMMRV